MNNADSSWNGLCRIGGIAALAASACFLMTMVVIVAVGAEPTTATEYFEVLQNNRPVGLLRLYFSDVIGLALYFPMYFGLYSVLRRFGGAYAAFATALAFVGITLVFATHSAFSMIYLSDQHAVATTEAMRVQFLAAGEATIARDIYKSSSGIVGGILLEGAAVMVSVMMLRSGRFGKVAPYAGILGNGLDLLHMLINIVKPEAGGFLMAVAGPAMLLWLLLLGPQLFRLGRSAQEPDLQAAA